MQPSPRIRSIDIVRGAVMVLMAIDHVRVYSGIPAGGSTAGIFFTRWITHFCAPAFVFIAGTAAFLYGKKLADRRLLSRYLLTRGLLLVVLELTVIRFAWTFNFDYRNFTLAGIIWMLGWSMVLLAGLTQLPTAAVGIIGLGIIFCQQAFRFPPQLLPASVRNAVGWIWEFVYPTGIENHSGITVLYVLIPWIGVMAAGYACGAIMLRPPDVRRQLCLRIGLAATLIYLLVGGFNVLTNPAPASAPPLLFRLLNQQKYPASQLFLLMTLGPTIVLLGLLERASGWFADALESMGRVPFFYYLLHIPLIHVAALSVMFLREGQLHTEWYASAPFTFLPPEHRWVLWLVYLIWGIVVAILFFACRWFGGIKGRYKGAWLRYF